MPWGRHSKKESVVDIAEKAMAALSITAERETKLLEEVRERLESKQDGGS